MLTRPKASDVQEMEPGLFDGVEAIASSRPKIKKTKKSDNLSEAPQPEPDEPSPAEKVALLARLAALPPRKVSTPEEIAARRAERRARIEADKAAGLRDTRGAVVKRTAETVILEMVRRQGTDGKPLGATMEELCASLDWAAPTVRGYIGGTLRPRGHDIRVARIKGEPRRYVIGHDGQTFALRGKAK